MDSVVHEGGHFMIVTETSDVRVAVEAMQSFGCAILPETPFEAIYQHLIESFTPFMHPDADSDYVTRIRPNERSVEPGGGFTLSSLPLHTDRAFTDNPPSILVTYVMRADADNQGSTTLCDIQDVINDIDPAVRDQLSQLQIENIDNNSAFPIFFQNPFDGRVQMRWREDSSSRLIGPKSAIHELRENIIAKSRRFQLESGDSYLVLNGYYLHGRTEFVDKRREVWRLLANPKAETNLVEIGGVKIESK